MDLSALYCIGVFRAGDYARNNGPGPAPTAVTVGARPRAACSTASSVHAPPPVGASTKRPSTHAPPLRQHQTLPAARTPALIVRPATATSPPGSQPDPAQ